MTAIPKLFSVSTQEKDLSRYALAIQQLGAGRTNAAGTVTLAANAATTTVSAPNCAAGSSVFLTPASANAAAEVKNGTLFISTVANRSFTITHANNAQTDRTFFYVCLG
ncbi:hypothetical protein [Bradyrhizobium sp. 2TAF24]|uniref:hypothetical protein n=1 Tax=Bradyrhizobium sp. 2TAF24 TaxID=3233011 RepID=UPI003F908136